MKYRPAIDGLRAIAVLSVCIFHLNHQWLPGGFVGVDIFFVLSGYLISKIIATHVEDGSFSIASFYQRRIARIFPAFLLTALTTLVVSKFVYSPQDFSSAGATFTAAILSVANMKYMLQGKYFEISSDSQPFLHYWSLAVEEQFYIFYPLLYFALHRYLKRYLALILFALFSASLVACIATTRVNPTWAFYLLPTRAWELLCGSLLAIWTLARAERASRRHELVSLICLGTLLVSLVFISDGKNFPGYLAVLPVLSTGIILITPASAVVGAGCERLLSAPPLPLIGRVSFSLYLWHWPIFSLVDYYFYESASEALRIGVKVAITTMLTAVSYNLVEKPARQYLNQSSKAAVAFAFVLLSIAAFAPLGLVLRQENYVNADSNSVARGGINFQGRTGVGNVILMGDSNGSMYGKLTRDICRQLECSLNVISVAAGDPLPTGGEVSNQLWIDSLDFVKQKKPDVLILAYAWTSKLQNSKERLDEALDALSPHADHIILLNQPPVLPPNANRATIRSGAQRVFFEEAHIRQNRLATNAFLESKINKKISVINISEKFERANGEIIFTDEKGRQMYQDATHISGFGADSVQEILSSKIISALATTQ